MRPSFPSNKTMPLTYKTILTSHGRRDNLKTFWHEDLTVYYMTWAGDAFTWQHDLSLSKCLLSVVLTCDDAHSVVAFQWRAWRSPVLYLLYSTCNLPPCGRKIHPPNLMACFPPGVCVERQAGTDVEHPACAWRATSPRRHLSLFVAFWVRHACCVFMVA